MTVPPCYCVSGWQAKSFSIVVSIQFSNHNVPNASEYLSFRIANCASDLWFCPCWKWCTPNCHLYRMIVLHRMGGIVLKANVTPKVLPSHLHVRRARCFFFFSTFWSKLFVKDSGSWFAGSYCTATSTAVNWDLQQRWRVAITVPRSGIMKPPWSWWRWRLQCFLRVWLSDLQ